MDPAQPTKPEAKVIARVMANCHLAGALESLVDLLEPEDKMAVVVIKEGSYHLVWSCGGRTEAMGMYQIGHDMVKELILRGE